jgi:uncharacterized membrane protein
MSNGNDFQDAFEQPIFTADLTPHRSLGRTGFLALMLFLSIVSFIAGIVFLRMGAWPVFGFFGLDVLLIYWAFRVNYRTAAAYEEVTVTPSELRVKKVSHNGEVAEWLMNPAWTRLDREAHEDFGLLALFLVSRGKRLRVAGFLAPVERETFARALSTAIGEAKRGVTRT